MDYIRGPTTQQTAVQYGDYVSPHQNRQFNNNNENRDKKEYQNNQYQNYRWNQNNYQHNGNRSPQRQQQCGQYGNKPTPDVLRWTEESSKKLIQMVDNMKKQGFVDWNQVSVACNGRYASACYNKYYQLTDKQWTDEENKTLSQFWLQNAEKRQLDYEELQRLIPGHNKRQIQYNLEHLTQRGSLKPEFRITRDEMKRID